MRRNSVLALSLAAGLALPFGLPTAALALTDAQRATLERTAASVELDMRAAISTVLNQEFAAQERPRKEVLDDLAAALLELGASEELQADYLVALVAVAGDLSDEAGKDAAEAVLVRAQTSPTLVAAVLDKAGDMALTGVPGGFGTGVLGAFQAAVPTSVAIDLETAGAVFGKAAQVQDQAANNMAGGAFGNQASGVNNQAPGTQFSNVATVGGFVGGTTSFSGGQSAGRGGGGVSTGAGQAVSPN